MIFDLSFVIPQALSPRSWILRVPFIRPLGAKPAWWNGLWVETFDLVTNERPESCLKLLDAVFPKWPGIWGPRGVRGYVWRDGFTIYRLMTFGGGVRPMGTGTFAATRGVTHVAFRVGANRIGVYVGLVFSVFLATLGVLMFVLALSGRVAPFWAAFAMLVVLIPLFTLVMPGRRLSTDGRMSEESGALLAILEDVIGARELPRS